jgi:hypothetical protein
MMKVNRTEFFFLKSYPYLVSNVGDPKSVSLNSLHLVYPSDLLLPKGTISRIFTAQLVVSRWR